MFILLNVNRGQAPFTGSHYIFPAVFVKLRKFLIADD